MARLGALLVSGALATTAITGAQSPGTFVQTGRMTAARSFHTATLLPSGDVLIAGGGSDSPVDSAELYEPGTGSFRPVGNMTAARRVHTATLLADERVLIVGGLGNDHEALASAELYDPLKRSFTPTGALITARAGHSAILLDTGEVLVIGGYGTRGYPSLAPAEIYDPVSGTFREAAPYVGRGGCDFCAPAVRLPNGTALFVGQTPAQVYDRAANAFSATGVISFEPSGAAALADGQVLFAGGESMGRLANAALYSPAAGAFTIVTEMSAPRVWHTLTALPDGTALAAGGETDSCSRNGCWFAGSVASAEVFDPSAGSFASTGSMTAARETHTATLLADGRVLMAGGVGYGGIGIFYGSLTTAELYTPATPVPAPSLVSLASNGLGQGAIYHAGTRHLATGDDPATADEPVDLTVRGLGPQSGTGVRSSIGGRFATVLSVTNVAGTDLSTVTVRVPRGIATGPAVPVRLFQMDRPSNDVTMAIR